MVHPCFYPDSSEDVSLISRFQSPSPTDTICVILKHVDYELAVSVKLSLCMSILD
jgi:hypothetical protein